MKIYLLSPFADHIFDETSRQALQAAGQIIPVKDVPPWEKMKKSFSASEEKIIAIDPRICAWDVPNEVLEAARNVIAICLQTTSFSWIKVDYAAKLKIPVTNVRGFSTTAVSEWATMMVLMLARKVPLILKSGSKPQFNEEFRGLELRERTAGVIGLGRIGIALAKNMEGLGMQVQYSSRKPLNSPYKHVSLDDLMTSSDVVLPALAKNEETKGLITDNLLRSMKKTAIFVSIVHEMYNHELLLDLIAQKKIFGYGFEQDNQDSHKGNVWSGPQMAWFTGESESNNSKLWAQSIVAASLGQYPNKVN